MSSTRTTLLAIAVLVATFVSGAAAGFFASHVMMRRGMPRLHEAHGNMLVDRLDRRLDLTDAQYAQVKTIVERRHERIMAISSDVRPAIRREILATNAEIEKVLTPEQRKKWDKIKMRLMPGHLGVRRR